MKQPPSKASGTFYVGNRRISLDNETPFDRGGEALIYKDPGDGGKALKVYHEFDKQREQKIKSFLDAGFRLPDGVVMPLLPIRSEAGKFAGFQMQLLSARHKKLRELFKGSYSVDQGFTTKVKAELFMKWGTDLNRIHPLGIVVGDLNDRNVMIHEGTKLPYYIDVDSWQYLGYPCPVATRFYCPPDLYGVDLSKRPSFLPTHDWWSWSVLLFQVLLNGVHPFKSGTHPRYIGVGERAINGITVLDPGVAYPNIGLPPEILTNELTDELLRMLKRKRRDSFPLGALKQYGEMLIECTNCKMWYPETRNNCPSCSRRTAIQTAIIRKKGEFDVSNIIVTRGRILFYQKDRTTVYCLAEEAGQLVFYKKEDNRPVETIQLGLGSMPGARFAYFSNCLVICQDPAAEEPELFLLDVGPGGVTPIKKTTTAIMAGGHAVFGASNRFLYRIAGRMIMCCERLPGGGIVERPVMQVHEQQTWFKVDRTPDLDHEYLFGYHRHMGVLRWFLIRGEINGRSFMHTDVDLPELDKRESLIDLGYYFSTNSCLIVRKTIKLGVERVRLDIVSIHDGKILKSSVMDSDQADGWEVIKGKAYGGGVVMHPTDKGIVKEEVIGTHSVELLPKTDSVVTSEDSLDRYGKGILVLKEDRILALLPK